MLFRSTRDILIDVARQLFALKGVEKTTMLDIAEASEKGRRTIYTYFKNKREIHQAVIEKESEQIVSRHRMIQKSALPPSQKLEMYIRARFDLQIMASRRFYDVDSLQNFLAGGRGDKTRRAAALKQVEIFHEILREGVEKGEFDADQARRLAPLVVMLMQGVDNPAKGAHLEFLGVKLEEACDRLIEFILEGIKPKQTPNDKMPIFETEDK